MGPWPLEQIFSGFSLRGDICFQDKLTLCESGSGLLWLSHISNRFCLPTTLNWSIRTCDVKHNYLMASLLLRCSRAPSHSRVTQDAQCCIVTEGAGFYGTQLLCFQRFLRLLESLSVGSNSVVHGPFCLVLQHSLDQRSFPFLEKSLRFF